MSPVRGPYKVCRLEGMDSDDVWFYREIDGTVSVHFDTRPIRETSASHVSFVIPKDQKSGKRTNVDR